MKCPEKNNNDNPRGEQMAMAITFVAIFIIGVHGEPIYIRACLDAKHVFNTIKDKCVSSEAVKRMSNILKAHKVDRGGGSHGAPDDLLPQRAGR